MARAQYQNDAEDDAEELESASDSLVEEDTHVSAWQDQDYVYDMEFDARRINP